MDMSACDIRGAAGPADREQVWQQISSGLVSLSFSQCVFFAHVSLCMASLCVSVSECIWPQMHKHVCALMRVRDNAPL